MTARDEPPAPDGLPMDLVAAGEVMVSLETVGAETLAEAQALAVRTAGAELTCTAAARRFGVRTALVSRIGADPFGQRIIDETRALGVVDAFTVDSDAPTGIMFKQIQAGERNVRYRRAGSAASRLSTDDLPRILALQPRMLLVTGVTLALGTGPRQLVAAAADHIKRAGGSVALDPNLRPGLGDQDAVLSAIRTLMPLVDVLITGRDEAEVLFGEADPDRLIDLVLTLGVREVIIKGGADGLWFGSADERGRIASHARHVVDPVGAGDALAGGYLGARLRACDLAASAEMASLVAARVVSTPGDTAGLPTADEVERLIGGDQRLEWAR